MIENDEYKQLYDDIIGLRSCEATLAYRKKQFEAENEGLREAIGILEAHIAERKDRLAAERVTQFMVDGNKGKKRGLAIRENDVLDYKPEDALAWAIEHKLALKLDTKAFDGYAKKEKPGFVTFAKVATATFPGNPDELLEEEE